MPLTTGSATTKKKLQMIKLKSRNKALLFIVPPYQSIQSPVPLNSKAIQRE
jgi:hypothetical protein